MLYTAPIRAYTLAPASAPSLGLGSAENRFIRQHNRLPPADPLLMQKLAGYTIAALADLAAHSVNRSRARKLLCKCASKSTPMQLFDYPAVQSTNGHPVPAEISSGRFPHAV
jgi:hypothetical protein